MAKSSGGTGRNPLKYRASRQDRVERALNRISQESEKIATERFRNKLALSLAKDRGKKATVKAIKSREKQLQVREDKLKTRKARVEQLKG